MNLVILGVLRMALSGKWQTKYLNRGNRPSAKPGKCTWDEAPFTPACNTCRRKKRGSALLFAKPLSNVD